MAHEIQLKYGCNPNQKPSRIFMEGGDLPLEVLNGRPGYINFLDALNSYQLVSELKKATGMSAAASFKHVSPAGAAIGLPLSDTLRKIYFVPEEAELSPIACAYARARGADRMSSFGDFIALSDTCDLATAKLIQHEVSDGIIAPGYTDEALAVLKSKRKGGYNVVRIDPDYVPAELERKMCYGVTFEQGRNALEIDEAMISNVVTANKTLTEAQKRDLLVALITLKYTQSNSVCYVKDGQAIGVGAGQNTAATPIAPVWRAIRRITGTCASMKRCFPCPSRRKWAALNGITPSTCISPRIGRMCWAKANGSSSSPCARNP